MTEETKAHIVWQRGNKSPYSMMKWEARNLWEDEDLILSLHVWIDARD